MSLSFRNAVATRHFGLMREFCSWQARRSRDAYTRRADLEGLRNRAAYKLIEMNNKYRFLRRDSYVVDLGSAPGGFAAAVAKTVKLDDRVRRWDQEGKQPVKRRITGRRRSRRYGKVRLPFMRHLLHLICEMNMLTAGPCTAACLRGLGGHGGNWRSIVYTRKPNG